MTGEIAPVGKMRNFAGTPANHPKKSCLPRSASYQSVIKTRDFSGTPPPPHEIAPPNYPPEGAFALVESGSGELVSCGFFFGRLFRMRDWIGTP
jgi:hypothetical protein